MIFLNKINKYKFFSIKNNLLYCIKIFNDFIFFSFLIKEYIKIYNLYSLYLLKYFIYLINMIIIKYIIYNLYYYLYYKNNNYDINNSNIYILELFYWKNKNFIIYNKYNNIEQKILLIKKISKTKAKGRIKKYKVIILLGNKSGWFGIGINKDYYLQNAIYKARIYAFKNIYTIPLFYSKILKNNIYLEKKFKKLYLFSSLYKIKISSHYIIRLLFYFIGINNINSKIIGIYNIYKILSLIINI